MIRLLVTGGTIDCEKYDKEGKSLFFQDTVIPEMVKQSKCLVDIKIQKLMLKDSLDISEKDREKILQVCEKAEEDKIIITHGTYTLPETAKFLGQRVKNKTIILMGAAVPYKHKDSDALFNFGTAVLAVQTVKPGVYITMNGKLFSWKNVKKNRDKNIFEEEK